MVPTYVDYMLGQCSSHHTIYFCLMRTSGGVYYWDSASSAYLCRLYAWAVQQQPHHLLLSYGNFWGSLRSPRWLTAKNIKVWLTTWIRRGPYLCRLYGWAVQQPSQYLLLSYGKFWGSYAALDGPQPKTSNFDSLIRFGVVPIYEIYMLRQCSSRCTIYLCLMGVSGGAYADGPQPKPSNSG